MVTAASGVKPSFWKGAWEGWKEKVSVWFYIPSKKDLAANACVYIFLLLLAFLFHYLTDAEKVIKFLNPQSPPAHAAILLLVVGFALNFIPIFFAIDSYFENSRQTFKATLGTTICVCALYAFLWRLFDRGLPELSSVSRLLRGEGWNRVLSALVTGSLISVVTSFRIGFSGNLESFDFKDFRRTAHDWKELVIKLECQGKLEASDHISLKSVTNDMLIKLRGAGRKQPSIEKSTELLEDQLVKFQDWYLDATKVAIDTAGIPGEMTAVVATIRNLC